MTQCYFSTKYLFGLILSILKCCSSFKLSGGKATGKPGKGVSRCRLSWVGVNACLLPSWMNKPKASDVLLLRG